jgi:hypothetical protein
MKNSEPLFIYFIPIVEEDTGDIVFSTTITDFEIKNNTSETAVIIMPHEFSIALEDENPEEVHPSPIVKMMLFDLVENHKTLLNLDKIIMYHNNTLDDFASILYEVKNSIYGKNSIIVDIIEIARDFYKKIENIPFTDRRLFNKIRKYYRKLGLVDFDESDELQKIIFDQLLIKRQESFDRKKTINTNVYKIISGYIENAFKIQAENSWKKLKEKGKLIYYAPGVIPID